MSVAQIQKQINGLELSKFVPVVSLRKLGQMAYERYMIPARCWPPDMVIGWQSCQVSFSEEALASGDWREDIDVDYPQPEVQ